MADIIQVFSIKQAATLMIQTWLFVDIENSNELYIIHQGANQLQSQSIGKKPVPLRQVPGWYIARFRRWF